MTRVVILDLLVERPAFGQGGNAEIMAPFAPAECLLLTPQLANRDAYRSEWESNGITYRRIDTPDSIEELSPDAVICSGSRANISTWEHWMDDAAQVLQQAVSANIPVLGICFGHQLLCKALGGEVKKLKSRTDNVSALFSVGMDTLLSPIKIGLFTHQDEVTQLPPGTRRIISTKHCVNAGIRVAGKPVWGVQFHPEASRTVIEQAHADGDMNDTEFAAFEAEHDGGALLSAFAQLCMP
jgi:GMP synthase-like glutamine amidotransferase